VGDTGHVAELGEEVRIDPRSDRPPYDQLRTQIIARIRDGRLPSGTRLPTVRDLARQLRMAVNTVARAYRELEMAGLVETRGRFGTYVARTDPADAEMARAAQMYVATARKLGVDPAEAIAYVEAEFGGPNSSSV